MTAGGGGEGEAVREGRGEGREGGDKHEVEMEDNEVRTTTPHERSQGRRTEGHT